MATPARSRQRQGSSRPTPRASRPTTTLPPYQPPTQPLNNASLQRLKDYSSSPSLGDVKKHLSQLNNLLAASAAHVNDRYSYRADYQARRRARLEDDNGDEIPGDAEAEAMRIRADELTVRIEEGVRASIDAQAKVEATEAALKEVYENASRGGGIVAPTQSTLGASQFRGTRRDLDDDEEDDGTDRQGLTGAVKTKIDDRQTRYTNLSMGERYSTNNAYATFKRLVHDAKTSYMEEAPPLANPSTWFAPDQSASAGTSQSQTATTATLRSNTSNPSFMKKAADNDSESDIEVAGEKISLKCPLTLLPMQDPLTSTKCPHSFEGEAILDMIKSSSTVVNTEADGTQTQTQRRGARGIKAIKCPVCTVLLTEADLRRDEVLVRKIRREQEKEKRRQAEDDWDEDDGPASRSARKRQEAEEIGSSDIEDGRKWSQLPRVKAERRSQAQGMLGGRSAPGRTEEIEDDD